MAQPAPHLETERAASRQPLQRRSSKRIALRVLADGMAISTSLFIASIARFEMLGESPAARLDYGLITLIATPLWIILFFLYGLYEPRQVLSPVNELKQAFHGVVAGGVLIFLADSLFKLNLARLWVLFAMVAGFLFVGGERLAVRKLLHYMRRRGGDLTRTIVLGANIEARTIAKTLQREGWLGYQIVGFVDDVAPPSHEIATGEVIIGRTSQLKELIIEHDARLILVAASAFDAPKLNRMFWELQDVDVDLQITSGTVDLMASRMTVQSVAGVPLLFIRRTGMDKIQKTLKRTIDLAGSLLGLIFLAPLLAGIAIWIARDSEGGIFFKQTRVGRDGELFAVWKFRTMFPDAEKRKAELEHMSQGPGLLFKLEKDRARGGRAPSAQVLAGRAAAALERPPRRDEPCRSEAGAALGGRAVRRLGAEPAQGETGDDRAVAGERPHRDQLRRLRAIRPLLHPELVPDPRPVDPVADPAGRGQRRGSPLAVRWGACSKRSSSASRIGRACSPR